MSYSKQMLEALSSGDLAQATVYFNEALSHDLPEEKLQLADNLYQLGFLEEASTLFKDLLTLYPDEDSLKISLGEIAIEEDKLEEAFEWLEQIKPSSDLYAQSLLTLADIYQMMEIPEVSEQKLKEAKQILPQEPLVDLALGELYFATESYIKAIAAYEEIKTTYPTFESPIDLDERIGVSLSRIGEYEQAVEFLESAIKQDETVERLFQLALCYYQIRENERSIELLTKVSEMNSEFNQVYYPLSQILFDEGRYDEALEVAEKGIHVNPYDVSVYHLASEASYQLNQKDQAKMYLEEVISLELDSDISKLKLAELFLKEEEFEETIHLVSSLDILDQGEAYWYLAQAYNGLEEYADAKKYYELASSYLDIDADFLKDYGLFLREEGQLDKSREVLTSYLRMVPDDLMIVSMLEE
ncbi:tetratricopeptide repeat protein [Vagococcus teuberi]|uniref:Uncharacterized protein n=1 Tax=Vagococcus teuberi TaxID=519472 RepID=A0A1J0A686_9ENTE|nr:tetratricopeptide repeat protein [Vagococcus teuberi]APB31448.1 hypothetical protein BHY08_06165 [Vagococcus teuberi]